MELLEKIKQSLDDVSARSDMFDVLREMPVSVQKEHLPLLRSITAENAKKGSSADYELNKKTYLLAAPWDFHSYMIYLEWDRPVENRFYQPRMKVLRPSVMQIQKLIDDELDELFISQPPRTGKTTLLMFLCTFLIGKDSEKSNLYSAYSDVITQSFYTGVLEVLNDPITYLWRDIFPTKTIANTNAKDETINIDRVKRYSSLTCRSLYGTLNGACDASGFIIADDLISGYEEALSKDRLRKAWSITDNNLLSRDSLGKAKILWNGTRWSIEDPIGKRMDTLSNNPDFAGRRYHVISLPALNEKDESNFMYDFGMGFSTAYYRQRRASFERNNDTPSWQAQYQGMPIERSGTVFAPEDMNYFTELPEEDPIRRFIIVDPAFGGGDFTAAVICYQYEDSIYIPEVVFTDAEKKLSQRELVSAIVKHKVAAGQFETTRATDSYREEVLKALREQGFRPNITSKPAPSDKAKSLKIWDKAQNIREFYYLAEGKRGKEYSQFMHNLFSWTIHMDKHLHDDAPDVLAQTAEYLDNMFTHYIHVGKRIF